MPSRASAAHHPGRRAFTLIELLVTITVLAILMAAVLGGMRMADEAARAARTRSTITKLNDVIMEQYDSYLNRRVPMDLNAYAQSLAGSGTVRPEHYARAKLNALKDLMRMEMPDRWSDVNGDPLILKHMSNNTPIVPALTESYRRALQRAPNASNTLGAAECLYLIVMNNPEAAAAFNNAEIGDTDRDGLKEFIDGWGNPIRFIRWPAGFIGNSTIGFCSDLQVNDSAVAPDPFNPARVRINNTVGPGYAIFPLIYSAGPDKIYDINIGKSGTDDYVYVLSNNNLNPYTNDGQGKLIGLPQDGAGIDNSGANGVLNHTDNIHNHRLLGR